MKRVMSTPEERFLMAAGEQTQTGTRPGWEAEKSLRTETAMHRQRIGPGG